MATAVPATPAGSLPESFRYASAGPFVSAFPPLSGLPNQLLMYAHASQHPQSMLRTAGPLALSSAVAVQPAANMAFFAPSSSAALSSHSSATLASSSSPLKLPSLSPDQPLHLSAFSAFVPAASISASVLSSSSPTSKASLASSSSPSTTGRPASSAAIAGLLNLSHSGSSASSSSAPSMASNTAAAPVVLRVSPTASLVKVEQQYTQQSPEAASYPPSGSVATASPVSSNGSSRGRLAESSSSTLEVAATRLIERLTEADGQTAALVLLRSLSTSPSSLAAVQSLIDTASRHLSDPSTTTANFLISLTAWLVNEMAAGAEAVSSPLSPFSSTSSLSKRRRSSLPPLPAASDSDDDTCPHCCAQKKGTRWSDKDDTNMLLMLKQGNDWEHIAKALKRTVRALKDRYCYLRKQMRKSGGGGADKKKKRKKRDDVSEHASSDYDSDDSSTDDDDSDDDNQSNSLRPPSMPGKPLSSAASTSSSSTSHSNPSLGSSAGSHTSQRSRSNESAAGPADTPPYLSPPSSPASSASSSFESQDSSLSSSPAAAPSMHPWSASEESQLFALLSAGRTIREASRQLGRSVAAVKGRLQRLKRSKNKRRPERQQRQDDDDMDLADDSATHDEATSYKFPMSQAAAALVLAGV